MPARIHIMPEDDDWLREHAADLEQNVRRRAFELYRHRPMSQGCPTDDWDRARRASEVCPLASIEETRGALRISAGVCGDADVLRVHVMPRQIVVEGADKYSVFELPSTICRDAVKASLRDGELTILAEKMQPRNPQ